MIGTCLRSVSAESWFPVRGKWIDAPALMTCHAYCAAMMKHQTFENGDGASVFLVCPQRTSPERLSKRGCPRAGKGAGNRRRHMMSVRKALALEKLAF